MSTGVMTETENIQLFLAFEIGGGRKGNETGVNDRERLNRRIDIHRMKRRKGK